MARDCPIGVEVFLLLFLLLHVTEVDKICKVSHPLKVRVRQW